jgi:conjugative transfer signal peptidase TraF
MAEESGMGWLRKKVRGSVLVVGQVKGNTVLHRAAPGYRCDSYDLAAPYNKAHAALYGTDRTLLYRALRDLAWLLTATTTGITVMIFSARLLHLRIVLTNSSAPAGIYRLNSVPAGRGDLVLACLPTEVAQAGLMRGYLAEGDCPAGAEPIAKVIGAMPGDVVELEPGWVAVNGSKFPNSQTALRDSAGRTLAHVLSGAHLVGSGEVWLFGFNNVRSWDARYFGPVPLANVRGVLRPLATW